MDTVADANVCEKNQTMEDCVLIYNSKIIMRALLLVSGLFFCCLHLFLLLFQVSSSSSGNSSTSYTYTRNSSNSTDCKGLRIRRSQLPLIFDSQYVSRRLKSLLIHVRFLSEHSKQFIMFPVLHIHHLIKQKHVLKLMLDP